MGLDVSLKGTGICVLPTDWAPGDWGSVKSVRLGDEGELGGMDRVTEIARRIQERVSVYGVNRAAIENYAFSFSANAITVVAELVGAIRYELWTGQNLLVRPIVASSARKTLFGAQRRMNRKEVKHFISIEMKKMGCPLESEDERDAFIIANRLRHDLGLPCLAAGE